MLLIRIIALLSAVALGVTVVLYVVSGDRRYLHWAWRIFKISLFGAVAILLLFLFERLWVVV